MGRFIVCTLHQILLADEIEEREMGRLCGTCEEKRKTDILVGKTEGKRSLGTPMHR
jgi:hypothetical protein